MRIERYETQGGWPGVRWEQEVPTGWTWHSVIQVATFSFGAVLGATVFWSVWSSGVSWEWSAIWGSAVMFAIIAPEGFNRFGASLEGKGGGGVWRTESERDRLARWKVKQIYRKERWRAEAALAKGTKRLMFEVTRDQPAPSQPTISAALEGFQSFEVGTEEEWFGDAAARELARLGHTPGCWVIVTGVEGSGVAKVAQSGRDKAGIVNLHLVLTDEFVGRRKELANRLASLE